MAVDDVYKVVVNQSMQDSLAETVLYYKVISEDPVLSDEAAIQTAIDADLIPTWQASVVDQLTFDCMTIQKVFEPPIKALREFIINRDGLLSGDPLPATVTFLFTKINNATGGVGKKGRIYCMGMTEENQKAGRLQAAAILLVEALADKFEANLATIGGGDFNPVWAVRDPIKPHAILSTLNVDQVVARPRLANQRRRRTPIRNVGPI